MKKQLSVISGICSGTKYLLCDETFDGLDPVMRQAVKALFVREMEGRGMTPIVASHNLRELEDICECVRLLHRGGILFEKDLTCYLNGILIWLIPFVLCLVPTFAMMCNYARWLERMLGTLTPGVGIGGAYQYPYLEVLLWTVLTKEMIWNIVVLAVAYLLVYHVALTAVMLSGNILNTLVRL